MVVCRSASQLSGTRVRGGVSQLTSCSPSQGPSRPSIKSSQVTFYQPGDPGSGHWSPEVAREQREEAVAPGAALVQAWPLPGLTSISCVSSPSPPLPCS